MQPGQAQGGAGLIFKLAQSKQGGDFSKIAAALPGVQELIAAAPQSGGLAKLAGGLLGSIGGGKAQVLADMAGLAGGFANLKPDSAMVSKFIPIVLEFVKGRGGAGVVELLSKALQK